MPYANITSVEQYFEQAKWHDVLVRLREIVLASGLTEELKWNMPWYTDDGKNIVGLYDFKDHAAISFMKGSILDDPEGILEKPGENSQYGRYVLFTSVDQVERLASKLRDYINNAVQVERDGVQVPTKSVDDYEVVPEFQERLDADDALREAFENLTPGRRKGYLLHFAGAKTSAGREARVEKYIDQILDGIGLHDQY